MVVGCGALGNEVLKNLALMGAQHLTLVDFDCVEMGNLSRSVLFTREDVGERKVNVAAKKLRQMNPEMQVNPIFGDISYDVGLGLLRQMDVVLGCVDSRWARYCINRLCMRAGIPWVDGGIDTLEGTARVFAPGRNCYACNLGPEGLKDIHRRLPCSGMIRRSEQAGHAPTTSITASIIGAVMVQEALKLLHPQADMASLCGKMFYYEGAQLSTKIVDFEAYDPECPVHTCWKPVQKTDLGPETSIQDALALLQKQLDAKDATIHLTADCFVDEVVKRSDNSCTAVMRPGRRVAAFLEQESGFDARQLNELYQHEYREIDQHFPYRELTLKQLGIPERDVLWVSAGQGDYYMEMV